MIPPTGHRKRGTYYRWLFFAAGPVEAAVTNKALNVQVNEEQTRFVGYGSFDAAIDALEHALRPGPYICGDQFTAADLYVGSQIGYGMMFGSIEKRPHFRGVFRPPPGPARRDPGTRAGRRADRPGRLKWPEDARRAAIALYDRFTHEGMDRRDFMAKLTRIAGSAAAASMLLADIAARAEAQPQVAADDHRLLMRELEWEARPGRHYQGYSATPAAANRRGPAPVILVIHENRGLNDHIRDVTRRFALAGFRGAGAGLAEPGRRHARGRRGSGARR